MDDDRLKREEAQGLYSLIDHRYKVGVQIKGQIREWMRDGDYDDAILLMTWIIHNHTHEMV